MHAGQRRNGGGEGRKNISAVKVRLDILHGEKGLEDFKVKLVWSEG